MGVKRKHILVIFIFVLTVTLVITLISFLSAPADKTITGNLILGKFNPADYKLNSVGEVISKKDNEVITKRSYNSKTYQNPDSSYTAVIGGGNMFFYDGEVYVEMGRNSLL